jgi:hypothetical protein
MTEKLCQAARQPSTARGNSLSSNGERDALPNCASLAFWDAHLEADPRGKTYLQSHALPEFSHGIARFSRRRPVVLNGRVPQLFHTLLGGVLPYY